MKKLLLSTLFLALSFNGYCAAPDISILPVNPMPSQVVQSTTVAGLQYQLKNNNGSDTYNVTFDNLNTLGKTYTTTCGSLAPSATCLLNITFTVPALPAGKTSEFYPHTFFILGAPYRVPASLSTTIVESAGSIAPTSNITWADPGICSGTYTVTLTGADEVDHVYSTVACGSTTLSPGIAGGTYTAHIDPPSVTFGISTYDAPADFSYHLAKAGDTANFVYTQNVDVSVSTNLTMPFVGLSTSAITCTGTGGTYGPHDQGAGPSAFDTMKPGTYTCTAVNYTGTDLKTYVAAPANPYTISTGSNVIAMTFAAKAPTTQHVFTALTLPNLATGSTVACTLSDVANTYGPNNQAAGTTSFDGNVEDANDYTFSCAPYMVGPDTYSMTTQTNVTIGVGQTTLTGVFSKNAPPGSNYDWHVNHMPTTVKNANVFAVAWGGGSTTAPVYIETNPPVDVATNAKIEAYESAPTSIGTHAAVQNFPGYIAQGSVSQFATQATDQLKAQSLDLDFHYEGNGDSSAGCAWDNSTGYRVAMNAASGSVGTVAAGTYNIIADYYQYNDPPPSNVFELAFNKVKSLLGVAPSNSAHFYKATTTVTNTSGLNYVVANVYTEVTSAITNAPDLTQVKTLALPANAVVTYTASGTHFAQAITPPNVNLNVDGLCGAAWYNSYGYTPQIDNIAAQAKEVKTATGHNLIAGNVFYTTRDSDSLDLVHDDLTNDFSIIFYLYNLSYDVQRMQYQYTTNSVDMVLMLNPDGTQVYQSCTQWYCPIVWDNGLTQDTVNTLITIPNLQADANKAIDRMVAKGYLSSGAATTLKANIASSGILTPPTASGRTVPGAPEYYLLHNYLIKYFGPNVPFGYGNNIYDNANPMMNVGTCPVANCPWQTGSGTWMHKVNHLKYSSGVVSQAIEFNAAKYAKFTKTMHYASFPGDPWAAYAPDYIFYDIYERDPIPGEVGSGRVMNGVDLDTYFEYIGDISALTNNQPNMIWQIPASSLQIQGATFTGVLAGTWPDYIFGSPNLNNDMSNLATALGIPAIIFVPYWQTSIYYTANSNVANLADYLKLTSASP